MPVNDQAVGKEYPSTAYEVGLEKIREYAAALAADLQRLVDIQKINDHIRPAEIALAQEHLQHTTTAITAARLRLDSLRLIIEGPTEPT